MSMLSDKIFDMLMEYLKDDIKSETVIYKIKKTIDSYIEKQKELNKISNLQNEIDFEGWNTYIHKNFFQDVETMFKHNNVKERKEKKNEIISKSIYNAKAETEEAKKRVELLTVTIINIIKSIYLEDFQPGLFILATQIEDNLAFAIEKCFQSFLFEMNSNKANCGEEDIITDDREVFLSKYKTHLFWNNNHSISLQDLYIYNEYNFCNREKTYNDLASLIDCYLHEDFVPFLREHKVLEYDEPNLLFILGEWGCGKSSLVAKIADAYNNEIEDNTTPICFVDLSKAKYNSELSFEVLINTLGLKLNNLKGTVLIIDGLDECIKNYYDVSDILSKFAEDLYDYGCKCIMTSRKMFFEHDKVQHSFSIELLGFTKNNALLWLENYAHHDTHIDGDKWKRIISNLNNSFSKIILNPLILYMCVVRDINLEKIDSLADLYYLLFDLKKGELAWNRHSNSKMKYSGEEWKYLRERVMDISVEMFKYNIFIDNDKEANEKNKQLLYNFYGIEFCEENDCHLITFAHSSIWQYFYAEKVFTIINDYFNNNVKNELYNKISQIISLSKEIDQGIMIFLRYFIKREIRDDISLERLVDTLGDIRFFVYNNGQDVIEWMAFIWKVLYIIIVQIINIKYPKYANQFFQLLTSSKYKFVLVRCSNVLNVSCIPYTSPLVLKECNFDGVNLCKTNMFGTVMSSSCFRDTNLSKAVLSCVYADHCDFSNSNFRNAYLKNGCFVNSNFSGCDFQGAHLNGADFSEAVLQDADLRGATLNKTIFLNTKLDFCKINTEQIMDIPLEYALKYRIRIYDKDKILNENEVKKLYETYRPIHFRFSGLF